MKLNVNIEDISNGKLYELNDLVKVDTRGCHGCSACCYDAKDSIVINPFDAYQLVKGTGLSFDELLSNKVGIHEEEKVLLPHLLMQEETMGCGFLDENERCSIHNYRPGVCRLFPFGRYYEDNDFKYFYQPGECIKTELTKIKVKKWIGIDNYNENKAFVLLWFKFLKTLKWRMRFIHDGEELKLRQDYVLDTFYRIHWQDEDDFYERFYQKIDEAKENLGLLL